MRRTARRTTTRARRNRSLRRSSGALAAALVALAAATPFAFEEDSKGQERIAAGPAIEHVFIVVLENEKAETTFGAGTKAPYLAGTLRSQGAYVPNYYGTAHASLGNYTAMISGQAPTPTIQADCTTYTDVQPGTSTGSYGQVNGPTGCVYPAAVRTIANTLEESGRTWKGYMEDMGTSCRHPAIGAVDTTQSAKVGDQYAGRHNPFIYFHSIIDSPTCTGNDVDYSRLAGDLADKSTTPDYAFITPNLCNDGHDAPCVDGRPGGLTSADAWLQSNIPLILRSPAFNDHGLLIITFDEASSGDASACCGEQSGPNTAAAGGYGPGGGRTGAVLLSPCITGGTEDPTAYNHYSMLASVEGYFGLPLLGYSQDPGLATFGSKVFTRPDCDGRLIVTGKCRKKKKKRRGSYKKRKRCRGKKHHKHHRRH